MNLLWISPIELTPFPTLTLPSSDSSLLLQVGLNNKTDAQIDSTNQSSSQLCILTFFITVANSILAHIQYHKTNWFIIVRFLEPRSP